MYPGCLYTFVDRLKGLSDFVCLTVLFRSQKIAENCPREQNFSLGESPRVFPYILYHLISFDAICNSNDVPSPR